MASITFTTNQGTEIALHNIHSRSTTELVKALIPFIEAVENANENSPEAEAELVSQISFMPLTIGGQLIWDPFIALTPENVLTTQATPPAGDEQLFSCGAPECEGHTAEELEAIIAGDYDDDDDDDEDDEDEDDEAVEQVTDLIAEILSDCEEEGARLEAEAQEVEAKLINEAYSKIDPVILEVKAYVLELPKDQALTSILGLGEYLKPAATSKPTWAGTPNTGASDADFFLGDVANFGVHQLPSYFQARDMEIDFYMEDTLRVTSNFTVNLGLRYENHPSALVHNNLFNTFDFKNDALVLGAPVTTLVSKGYANQAYVTGLQNVGVKFETPSQAGFPATLMRNYPWNFLPRLGFAYQPYGDGKTVFRGGFGRYLYPIPTRSVLKSPIQNLPFTSAYSQDFTNPSQTPDGIQNAQLRFPQGNGSWSQGSKFLPILGVNTANAVNSSAVSGVLPGVGLTTDSLDMAPDIVTNGNFTVEQPLARNQALRMSYVYSHGSNLDHNYMYNNAPSAFAYELATGNAPNTTNGSQATRPYDNTTWGNSTEVQKNGWSNYNALQVNYEKRAQKGIAYQVSYTWAKGFRIGGNSFRDSTTYPYANYQGALGTAPGVTLNPAGTANFVAGGQIVAKAALPPPPPAGTPAWGSYHDLIRFENYVVDTAVPAHHIRFNAVVDLPFGRNKRFLGKSNRWEDAVVGGWQVAAIGQVISQNFFVASGNWGAVNPIQMYKHGLNVTDCQTGICQPGKLWFNGFILPSAGAMGKITGLPSGYQVGNANSPAYSSPINFAYTTTPGTIQATNNNVNVITPGGTIANVGYSPGPSTANPFARTALRGPYNYNADISLYKVFAIREAMFLRINFDAFNAFNIQGYNNPNTTSGIIDSGANGQTSSYWTPRQVQLTARFTF